VKVEPHFRQWLIAFVKLTVAILINEHPSDNYLSSRKGSGAHYNCGSNGLCLISFTVGKQTGRNRYVLLFAFTCVSADPRAIDQASRAARTDVTNAEQELGSCNLRFYRLLDCRANVDPSGTARIVK
jgi:hypothetical protein